MWMFKYFCSSRDGIFHHEGDSVSDMAYSSAKNICFNESRPWSSGFTGGFIDFKNGFLAKENEFNIIHDDFGFNDLRLD